MANSSKTNLYSILNCIETSSYEELKRNYQKLIRECHPDKNVSECGSEKDSDKFQEIDNAWKILRDDTQRKIYDATLMQDIVDNNSLIYAELERDELDFKDGKSASYPCRCGSTFVILKSYLGNDEQMESILIECEDCSNCISVR